MKKEITGNSSQHDATLNENCSLSPTIIVVLLPAKIAQNRKYHFFAAYLNCLVSTLDTHHTDSHENCRTTLHKYFIFF